MGCTYKRKRLAGTDCVGCTCDWKQFCHIIVFFSSTIRISVFERSPVAHDLILSSVCVPGGHIPDGFWVVWKGPPPIGHTHLATVPNAVAERGKNVFLGPTRTSDGQET